jgi:hypothetical protein
MRDPCLLKARKMDSTSTLALLPSVQKQVCLLADAILTKERK